MIFHFGTVKVVQQERRTLLDDDGVISSVKWCSRFERDLAFEIRGRKQIASDKHELEEDLFQLVGVRVDDLVFLESFKLA